MPSVTVVTVKSSGGDYTSLASAEAGEQADLVAADVQLTIECYASAAGDSTQVSINGWTTDATRYVRIVCPVGERHAGAWDAAKYYLQLSTTGDPGGAIAVFEDYTRLEFLQVRNTLGSPAKFNNAIYSGAIYRVDGCLARGGYDGIGAGASGSEIRNSVAYGAAHAGGEAIGLSGGFTSTFNCTLVGATYGLYADASVNYPVATNVYAHGGTTGFGPGAGGLVTKTNCVSSDTSATNNSGGGGATNCVNSVPHSTANFASVTAGSEDYHLVTGSALIDAGADLSGTFTDDVDGTTRPQGAAFDVGADEFAAGGATFSPAWAVKRQRSIGTGVI